LFRKINTPTDVTIVDAPGVLGDKPGELWWVHDTPYDPWVDLDPRTGWLNEEEFFNEHFPGRLPMCVEPSCGEEALGCRD
jgi:hypothetical protein